MARGKRKRDKRWMWVAKPGDKIVASRTAAIPSKKLSKREFRELEEILNIYSRMLGDVLPHASRNIIESYYRLKNEKYRELRSMYPNIPPHYIHGVFKMLLKGYTLSGGTRLNNMLRRSSTSLLSI
jgi:hypothetical protein